MKRRSHEPLFTDPAEILRFIAKGQAAQESPGERHLRHALKYHTLRVEIGQAFSDKRHLGLQYPLSNRVGGRKRKRAKDLKFVPWYQGY